MDQVAALEELHAVLRTLGWSGGALARRLGIAEAGVHRFLQGRARIPPHLLEWLLYLAEPLRLDPPDHGTYQERLGVMPRPLGWASGGVRRPRPRI